MGNYSLTNIFTKEPVAIAGGIRSILYVAVLLGLVSIGETQLAGIALGLEVVLGLFARQNSTSTTSPSLQEGTAVTNPAKSDPPPPDLVVARVQDVNPTSG